MKNIIEMFSHELNQWLWLNKDTGNVKTFDKVIYKESEIKALEDAGTCKELHLIKKVFPEMEVINDN